MGKTDRLDQPANSPRGRRPASPRTRVVQLRKVDSAERARRTRQPGQISSRPAYAASIWSASIEAPSSEKVRNSKRTPRSRAVRLAVVGTPGERFIARQIALGFLSPVPDKKLVDMVVGMLAGAAGVDSAPESRSSAA